MADYIVDENEKDINPYGIQISKAVDFLRRKTLIGLGEDQAIDFAKMWKYDVRVVEKDGQGIIHTAELSTNRINLTIKDGKVVNAAVY